MLKLVQVEEIEALLLQLPGLVQQQENRAVEFPSNASAWLKSLEAALTANRLSQAGTVATLRSGLVAASQGQLPAGLEFRGKPSRSRVMHAVASQTLHRAAEVAAAVIAEMRPRLTEAERVAQQVAAAALSRRMISAPMDKEDNKQRLQGLRRDLAKSEDLENAVVHLEGLVGPYDALVLLDRALSPYEAGMPKMEKPAARPCGV